MTDCVSIQRVDNSYIDKSYIWKSNEASPKLHIHVVTNHCSKYRQGEQWNLYLFPRFEINDSFRKLLFIHSHSWYNAPGRSQQTVHFSMRWKTRDKLSKACGCCSRVLWYGWWLTFEYNMIRLHASFAMSSDRQPGQTPLSYLYMCAAIIMFSLYCNHCLLEFFVSLLNRLFCSSFELCSLRNGIHC